jgi:hypothetical protein
MTLEDLIQQVDAEELSEQARIEALLEPYRDSQDAANLYGKMAGEYGVQIKQYLQLNPEVELADSEHGLTARLQTRKLPGKKFDFIAIRDGNTSLLNRLIACGALTVNFDAAKAQGLEGELKRYEVPSGETTALIVTRL